MWAVEVEVVEFWLLNPTFPPSYFFFFIQALNPHQLSLPLKFWDTVLGKYRTLELHCPSTVTPSPHTTTTTHTRPPTPPKPHVFCSARHMRVELPPGPISGIVVKGKCVSVGGWCVFQVHMVVIIPA